MTTRVATTLAPAKVNLFLRVLHRRDDGFRELETLFQAIEVADRVTVEVRAPSTENGGGVGRTVSARVSIEVSGADVGPAEENLAWRAAAAFVERFEVAGEVSIQLEKRIPAGAGLGGGSSDAAAVLRCLHALTGMGEPHELAEIGLGLGSDVPFFLTPSGLALGRGRGEQLVPLPALPVRPLLLSLPPTHVSTADAYRGLSEARSVDDPHGGPRALAVQDLRSWASVDALSENDFARTVPDAYPTVARGLAALQRVSDGPTLLSGSGAASFCFVTSSETAHATAATLNAEHGWPFVPTSTRTGLPGVEISAKG